MYAMVTNPTWLLLVFLIVNTQNSSTYSVLRSYVEFGAPDPLESISRLQGKGCRSDHF